MGALNKYSSYDVDPIARRHYAGPPSELQLRWEYYNAAEYPLDWYHDFAFPELDFQPGDTVVDVGCSDARQLVDLQANRRYRQLGLNVIGLDISVDISAGTRFRMNELVAKSPGLDQNVQFLVGSMNHLPFADNSIDEMIHGFDLYHGDPKEALGQTRAALKGPESRAAIMTSGEGNKPQHRAHEHAIAEELGITPPDIMAVRFNREIAEVLLHDPANGFRVLKEARQETQFIIRKSDKTKKFEIYAGSLLSMKGLFGEDVSYARWQKVVDRVVKEPIFDEVESRGEWADDIRRYGYIVQPL